MHWFRRVSVRVCGVAMPLALASTLPLCAAAEEPLEGLKGPYLDQRKAAVQEIKSMDDAQQQALLPDLVALLDADNWQTQLHAAKALGVAGATAEDKIPTLVQRMKQALDKGDRALFRLMGQTVGAIQPETDPEDMKSLMRLMVTAHESGDTALADGLAASLTASGAEAVDLLKPLLQHEEETVQRQAVRALGGIGPAAKPVIPDLIALAADNEDLRREIERTLRDIKQKDNTPPTVSVADGLTCLEGKSTVIPVTISDTDDLPSNLSVDIAEQPSQGSVEKIASDELRFAAAPGGTGPVTFTIRGRDDRDKGEPLTVSVTVKADTEPPVLEGVASAGAQAVKASFNEPVTTPTAQQISLEGGPAVAKVEASDDGTVLTIAVAQDLQTDQHYTLSIADLADQSKAQNSGSVQQSFKHKDVSPGLIYEYYETKDKGKMAKLHEGVLEPTSTSTATSFNTEQAQRRGDYGQVYKGLIQVDQAGTYTFFTKSDDGSHLWVNGEHIVDNGGWHGMEKEEGSIELQPGMHSFVLLHFQGGGGAGLEAGWQPPSGEESEIPASRFYHRPGM